MSERVHGGLHSGELSRLGLDAASVLDFSVNTNPYGPAPEVLNAIYEAPLDRYPDPRASTAHGALAELTACPVREILLGNGAAELLWAVAGLLVREGDPVLVIEPTFSEFRHAVSAIGGSVCEWRADRERDFRCDWAAVRDLLRQTHAKVLYVCGPNTPTGTALDLFELAALARNFSDLWIVLDQSFLSMSAQASDAKVGLPQNVIRVRSLTKDHAVPGVRVGYLLAKTELIESLDTMRPAWPTTAAAQAVACVTPHLTEFINESRRNWLCARADLAESLAVLGFRSWPSSTGFFLLNVGAARQVSERLLERQKILVRDCSSFGLPDCIRIAARTPIQNQRLLAALHAEVLT